MPGRLPVLMILLTLSPSAIAQAEPSRANVVILISDDQMLDALGCAGNAGK